LSGLRLPSRNERHEGGLALEIRLSREGETNRDSDSVT